MFEKFAQRYFKDLDATMRQIISAELHDEAGFGLMLRYALGWVDADDKPYPHTTGKRLRPLLMMLVTEANGGNYQAALPAGAAVELLHNFSLIHDDIQDDSATRHNRPTVWKVWGIANAINAGDAMFAAAYSALSQLEQHIDPARTLAIWRIFNRTNLELTRGQHLDMRYETQDVVSVEAYLSMIRGKSAALLSACAQIGALIARDDEQTAAHYADFGLNTGIAFQIRDDILGIWGDPDITGKSAATDIISRKKSLPVLYGLAQSDELTQVYHRDTFGIEDVAESVRLLDALGARDYAHEQEMLYYTSAMQALDAANPQGEAGKLLREFIDILFQRTY